MTEQAEEAVGNLTDIEANPIGPGPDYLVKQYRPIKAGNGTHTRGERVGVAWQNANGSICVRLNGIQVISNDVFLFPTSDNTPS